MGDQILVSNLPRTDFKFMDDWHEERDTYATYVCFTRKRKWTAKHLCFKMSRKTIKIT